MSIKLRIEDLACFGGVPLFRRPRSIGQLHRPDVEQFLKHLRQIHESRQFTGNGPLVGRLEERLRDLHCVRHCVAVANAGLAITLLLRLFAASKRGEVIMPAFTFRGLPHFARWAGQLPRFCDVVPASHTLSPASVDAAVSERTTAVLSVCNSNSPGDVEGLERVAASHGVPLLFDSVYGLGASYRGKPLGRFGRAEVFSLHATKLLNGFEGGYVTTDDGSLAAELRRQRSMNESAGSGQPGVNATLNEIHAAMALCSLDDLDGMIARNRERHIAYRDICADIPGLEVVPCGSSEGERSNYSLSLVDASAPWPLSRDQTVALLQAENARITAYYSPPLHRSPHCPPGRDIDPLPVTEHLAERLLQVPVGDHVSLEDIERIGALLRFVGRLGEPIRKRLEAIHLSEAGPRAPGPENRSATNPGRFSGMESAFRAIFQRRYYANNGPLVRRLDRQFADYLGVAHAVAVTNETAALMIALRTLLPDGGEVIVPAVTPPATLGALVLAGVDPVFADVDPESYTLTADTVAPRISRRAVAILGVHTFGRPCDPDGLEDLARRKRLQLIFDATQALGCHFRSGRIGGFGDAEVFSFREGNVLSAAEGGCITTRSRTSADRFRTARNFHPSETFAAVPLRMNGKMSEAQAALALLALDNLSASLDAGQQRLSRYAAGLRDLPGLRLVHHDAAGEGNRAFAVVELEVKHDRALPDLALAHLRSAGVAAGQALRLAAGATDAPVARDLCRRLIRLPSGPGITPEQIDDACAALRSATASLPAGVS